MSLQSRFLVLNTLRTNIVQTQHLLIQHVYTTPEASGHFWTTTNQWYLDLGIQSRLRRGQRSQYVDNLIFTFQYFSSIHLCHLSQWRELLFSAPSLLTDGSPRSPQCNLHCLKFYKIPTALQLPSLACQDSSISNSVSWCLDLCQGPAFAPNDSQLRGHWEGLNSICRPSNLIRGAGFLFSPKFAVARMNDGQRMSCQHQQRLGDKRKKMREYKKNFFRREMSLLWLTAQWAVEWIVQVTMLCLQSVTLCGLLKQEWIQLPGRCQTNSKESFSFFF